MPILAAVPDSPEGKAALHAAVAEARVLGTDLLVLNLSVRPLDVSELPTDVKVEVLDRRGKDDRDQAESVLDEIGQHGAERLIIGVKRRSPVGKAILGSLSQRLLLESPIPVLAVKVGGGEAE
jgi:nucleotide-binding universal stress UspA family protein